MSKLLLTLISLLLISACNNGTQKPPERNKPEAPLLKTKQFIVENSPDSALINDAALMDDAVLMDKNVLTGKINFGKSQHFDIVPKNYSTKEVYIRKETLNAFLGMAEAAQKSGVNLKIISGARSFEHQKAIWNRKWNRSSETDLRKRALNILTYSAMPMTSRHHWGTDIDLNSLSNGYFEKGEGLKIYQWLTENAHKYGFCQVYSDKTTNSRTGYKMEKWHWSYMPLAKSFLRQYIRVMSDADLAGFEGSTLAKDLAILKDYVKAVADLNQP